MEFLQNLGALDNAENITGLGTVLANLPVDAVIGKMLLMATVCGYVNGEGFMTKLIIRMKGFQSCGSSHYHCSQSQCTIAIYSIKS